MKPYSILIFFTLIFISMLSCKSKTESTILRIDKNEKIHSIQLIENDSLKTVINVKDGKILSISKYRNKKLNGELLSFYQNGELSKKQQISDGISNGHYYEFYESGALAFHNYYCNLYPCLYGVELWDQCYEVMRTQIYYGERGEIKKLRLYDTLGNFLKDSIPK